MTGNQAFPANGPCRFLSLVGIIETQTGVTFSQFQIEQILAMVLQAGGRKRGLSGWPYPRDMPNDKSGSYFWYTLNPETILKAAASFAGYDLSGYRIFRAGQYQANPLDARPPFGAVSSIRDIGGHFQEGNGNGDFVWDPFSGNDPHRAVVRHDYFTFALRRKK